MNELHLKNLNIVLKDWEYIDKGFWKHWHRMSFSVINPDDNCFVTINYAKHTDRIFPYNDKYFVHFDGNDHFNETLDVIYLEQHPYKEDEDLETVQKKH